MPRLPVLALLAVLVTGCGSQSHPVPPTLAAQPQTATLDWVENCRAGDSDVPCEGKSPARVVFGVSRFEVRQGGWQAEISLTNRTSVRLSVVDPHSSLERLFGVMLFQTGDLRQLEQLNRARDLPPVRRAEVFQPALPLVLEPGQTWDGVISAPGALPAGRWLRVVFGELVSIGTPPAGLPEHLVWITDHAYRLEG